LATFPNNPLEIGFAQDRFLLTTSSLPRSLGVYVRSATQVDLGDLVDEILRLSHKHLGYGEDGFDQSSIWFAVVEDGRLVGTLRLVYPGLSTATSLPLEKGFHLSENEQTFSFDCNSVVEVSRLLIPRAGASAEILADLVSACLLHAYRNNIHYAICAARPRQTKLFTRKFPEVVVERFALPYASPLTGEGYALLSLDITKYIESRSRGSAVSACITSTTRSTFSNIVHSG
jgi:hypothetical protein